VAGGLSGEERDGERLEDADGELLWTESARTDDLTQITSTLTHM